MNKNLNLEKLVEDVSNEIILGYPDGIEKANEKISEAVKEDPLIGIKMLKSMISGKAYIAQNEKEAVIERLTYEYTTYKALLENGIWNKINDEIKESLRKYAILELEDDIELRKKMVVSEPMGLGKYKNWREAVNELKSIELSALAFHVYDQIKKLYNEMGLMWGDSMNLENLIVKLNLDQNTKKR